MTKFSEITDAQKEEFGITGVSNTIQGNDLSLEEHMMYAHMGTPDELDDRGEPKRKHLKHKKLVKGDLSEEAVKQYLAERGKISLERMRKVTTFVPVKADPSTIGVDITIPIGDRTIAHRAFVNAPTKGSASGMFVQILSVTPAGKAYPVLNLAGEPMKGFYLEPFQDRVTCSRTLLSVDDMAEVINSASQEGQALDDKYISKLIEQKQVGKKALIAEMDELGKAVENGELSYGFNLETLAQKYGMVVTAKGKVKLAAEEV